MNLIVAVDENWAIGNGNQLLVSIPQDMKFFRETTMGKVVVCGRKIYEEDRGGVFPWRQYVRESLFQRTLLLVASSQSLYPK